MQLIFNVLRKIHQSSLQNKSRILTCSFQWKWRNPHKNRSLMKCWSQVLPVIAIITDFDSSLIDLLLLINLTPYFISGNHSFNQQLLKSAYLHMFSHLILILTLFAFHSFHECKRQGFHINVSNAFLNFSKQWQYISMERVLVFAW